MLSVLQTLCTVLLSVLGGIYIYRGIFLLLGLFWTKRFSPAKKLHRYAILIAARNEEAVIGHLLDSIRSQDYPAHLLTTFVVADNCTDHTAEMAREHGAVCYQRHDPDRRTKGYALQFLMENIFADYGKDAFEGYFVFDADNLLTTDFVSRMNDAFDSGEKITVGYRNTKNLADNAISASYAFHWMRTARLENRGRSILGLPVRLQGTGFLVSAELLRQGWQYTDLTEDRAFTCDAILRGTHIAYHHMAMFYDEQPTSVKIALRQRLRWGKGNMMVFGQTLLPLLYGILIGRPKKSGAPVCRQKAMLGPLRYRVACYDMLLYNLPRVLPFTVLSVLSAVLSGIALGPISCLTALVGLILKPLSNIPQALLLLFTERKRMQRCRIGRLIWLSVAFPIFTVIGDITTWLAVFMKVTWTPIPHDASLTIEQMKEEKTPAERR